MTGSLSQKKVACSPPIEIKLEVFFIEAELISVDQAVRRGEYLLFNLDRFKNRLAPHARSGR